MDQPFYHQEQYYSSPQAHHHLPTYSNPSSIHSSPCSYPLDLEVDLTSSLPPSSSLPFRKASGPNMRPKMNSVPLQVATGSSTLAEHDPSEFTARPGNAHTHAAFHSHSLTPQPAIPDDSLSCSVLAPTFQPNEHLQLKAEASSSASSHISDSQFTTSTPGVSGGLTRPLTTQEQERLIHLDRLKFFLATAPSRWDASAAASSSTNSTSFHSETEQMTPPPGHPQSTHPALNRFLLPSNEYVTCVLWNGLYHITGTDIVRALVFRFEAFGRPVRNMKKFEEGVFSDLRNLKPGADACLEEPKSPFLDLLFKYQCIRTQKKQKVFYWFSVPHDRLFLDALERDLKREKTNQETTTVIIGEPALSFTYDSKRTLYEQFSQASGAKDGEGELEAAVRRADEARIGSYGEMEDDSTEASGEASNGNSDEDRASLNASDINDESTPISRVPPHLHPKGPLFNMVSLFGGSPTYKQRRKRGVRHSALSLGGIVRKNSGDSESERGRYRSRVPSNRYASASESESRERSDMEVELDADYGSGLSGGEMAVSRTQPGEGRRYLDKRKAGSFSGEGHGMGLFGGDENSRTMRRKLSSSSQNRAGLYDGFEGAPQSLSNDRRNSYPAHLSLSGGFDHLQRTGPHGYPSDGYVLRKVQAYVCPLVSCGRLFKQAEDLKRHLGSHAFEGANLTQTFIGSGDQITDIDLKTCEVEVYGDVQDIPGNDGGLMAVPGTRVVLPGCGGTLAVAGTANSVYVLSPTPDTGFASPYGEQWATRQQFSPAFSTHSSLHSFSGGPVQRSLSSSSASSQFGMEHANGSTDNLSDYGTSMSAPSHRLSFDHSIPPYSASILDGTGPVRRHRSMTPSLARMENSRRPVTAGGGEFTDSGRVYHPYMRYSSANNSRGGSAQSSPATYPTPLEYVSSQGSTHNQPRSSRGGTLLDDQQLAQFEALHVDQGGDSEVFNQGQAQSAPMSGGYGNVYRTESPAPYAVRTSPAPLVQASPHSFGGANLPYEMGSFGAPILSNSGVGTSGPFIKQESWDGGQGHPTLTGGPGGVRGDEIYPTFVDHGRAVL